MRISKLCFEVNGGDCKNKVSARNEFICAAGHSKDSDNHDILSPTVLVSKIGKWDKKQLAWSTKSKEIQLELFRTGDIDIRYGLARNLSLDKTVQLELFHTGSCYLQEGLAQNPAIAEETQKGLAQQKDGRVRHLLAQNLAIAEETQLLLFDLKLRYIENELPKNPAIAEKLQWMMFQTGERHLWRGLAKNPSVKIGLATELAKEGISPIGYTENKSIAELIRPENLALTRQYPRAFGRAYLCRLVDNPQEDKEESKALILHSYLVYEKSGGKNPKYYKDEILETYADDQEVTLIISGETA